MHRSVPRVLGRTRATVLGAALLAGTALPAAGLWAGSASAAPTCTTTGSTTVCNFAYTGSATSWAVPAGVTALTVTADGGAGANASSSYIAGGGGGGKGGEFRAELTNIPASTTLSVFPGGAASGATGGTDAGAGGGNGHGDSLGNIGGGGGGASTVSLSSYSVSNLLVVAGGGGGGAAENLTLLTPARGGNGGGDSATTGQDGSPLISLDRGRGGSTTAGGANGGALGCTSSATSGSQVKGGNSNSGACAFAGGGGGSGYFGGGGSASFAGGGGGAGFPAANRTVGGITVAPVTTDHNTNSGNGSVRISYVAGPTSLSVSIRFNSQQTFTVSARLTSSGAGVAGQTITFSTGSTTLCTAVTNSHGFASCALTYSESVAIRQNSGRYRASFAGTTGYNPSSANGQAIIHP